MAARLMAPLRILHVLRTPVGGLFRHVLDLTRGQIARGHAVGLILDSSTGGAAVDAALNDLAPALALGLTRFPMRRTPGLADLGALMQVKKRVAIARPDVVHGHGAKGGLYARLASNAVRAYSPHGGSLHYSRDTLAGRVYLGTERLLLSRTDVVIVESASSAGIFERKIGTPRLSRVVHNGVAPGEFEPVPEAANATDLLFIGELRHLKGIDVLLEAIARIRGDGRALTATIVGGGNDRPVFEQQAMRLGLAGFVHFAGVMPARQAFALGRVLVVPSRAEGLPYVILEAGAAGKPVIATRVGGNPEIFGADLDRLVPPGDAPALAAAIASALDRPDDTQRGAAALRARIAEAFTIDAMVEGALAAYAEAAAAQARR
jgi:glycosyltransferase involved in cell wall biosynthesis